MEANASAAGRGRELAKERGTGLLQLPCSPRETSLVSGVFGKRFANAGCMVFDVAGQKSQITWQHFEGFAAQWLPLPKSFIRILTCASTASIRGKSRMRNAACADPWGGAGQPASLPRPSETKAFSFTHRTKVFAAARYGRTARDLRRTGRCPWRIWYLASHAFAGTDATAECSSM